jgi:myo-inositol 2-dehydrogenase/D-chiro-inositol 1-dehydrogenase
MATLPALRFAPIELVAVCDLDIGLAERAAHAYGAAAQYSSYRDLLDREELDAVAVVGPPDLHYTAGLEVLASGRHLFVEKPPAMTLAQARQLAEAAGGLQVMVGFQKRHARAYQLARQAAASPEFGRPSMLRLNYSHVRTAPLSEHLAFMSIHALDLARYFLGEVTAGSAHISSRNGQHVIALTLEHAGAVPAVLSLSALEPRLQETLELAGDSALLRVRDLCELTVEHAAPEWEDCYQTGPSMMAGWRPDFTIPTDDNNSLVLQGYAGEMIEFAEAIQNGRVVNGGINDAVAAMRIIEAIYQAPHGFSDLDLG